MQNIILGIACTNTPSQAEILLIDPKLGVDYFAFEGLPHLREGIIDDQSRAIERLNSLVDEMNRRYTVLRANKVANIFDLNTKPNATERLPFLWIIHDEFAEWMMTPDYADAVSRYCRPPGGQGPRCRHLARFCGSTTGRERYANATARQFGQSACPPSG